MERDRLSLVFAALADPSRRHILARLKTGPATVTELAAPLPMSMPAVSRHLKVLETAGLISRDRQAQWRSSSLQVEPMRAAMQWMEQLGIVWDQRFDLLDTHLAARHTAAAATNQTHPEVSRKQAPTTEENHHD